MIQSRRVARLLFAFLLLFCAPVAALAAPAFSPADDLAALNAHVQRALVLTAAGDLGAAAAELEQFRAGWPAVEDSVRAESRGGYSAIEQYMGDARYALAHNDAPGASAALEKLARTNESVISGAAVAAASPAATGAPTIATLLTLLDQTEEALRNGNLTAAQAISDQFRATWPDVEGQVKTRSAAAYGAIENDTAELAGLVAAGDAADAMAVAARLRSTLQPFVAGAGYGLFDATVILLREGLEALLVLAALLAFLTRSGNEAKRGWIWAGGLLGIAASLLSALLIALVFQGLVSGSNRELIEGFTGLFAALMLFYVSYWLHSKSHLGAWQRYIRTRTSAALATGSLFSLSLLSFLAVYREGAETALFYIGIAPNISLEELLAGVGVAAALLLAVGLAIFRLGVRIPLRPFFMVTSALIFYLGFKFIGTGIHALQVARLVPSTHSPYLIEFELLGLFPSWETTIPQLLLLGAATLLLLLSRRTRRPLENPAAVTASD